MLNNFTNWQNNNIIRGCRTNPNILQCLQHLIALRRSDLPGCTINKPFIYVVCSSWLYTSYNDTLQKMFNITLLEKNVRESNKQHNCMKKYWQYRFSANHDVYVSFALIIKFMLWEHCAYVLVGFRHKNSLKQHLQMLECCVRPWPLTWQPSCSESYPLPLDINMIVWHVTTTKSFIF